jgi:exopolysaccharide biosynthesis polyprenyl glycosylphosphotransferase
MILETFSNICITPFSQVSQVMLSQDSAILSANLGSQRMQLRPSLERLRSQFTHPASTYHQLRAFLPVPVLFAVWLTVLPLNPITLSGLVNASITFHHLITASMTCALWLLTMKFWFRRRRSLRKDILSEISSLVIGSIVASIPILIDNGSRGKSEFGLKLMCFVFALFLLSSALLVLGAFVLSLGVFTRATSGRKAIIIGSASRSMAIRDRARHSHSNIEIVGCLDDEYGGAEMSEYNYLGPISSLAGLLKSHPIEMVLIGLPIQSQYDQIQSIISLCETVGVESQYMLDIFAAKRAQNLNAFVHTGHRILGHVPQDIRHFFKRTLDILLASIFLIIAAPVMCAIAIGIKCTSTGPVFFLQKRYGLHRRVFEIFKFRTMVQDAEVRQAALESLNEASGPVFKLKTDPRITKFGTFLRKTSLDELPQLINVLRGEMSLVGPRPLPLRDVSKFDESWLLRRFSVLPGLTCLWQVGGRSNTSFEEWIKLDLKYIDGWSLKLDMQILLMTIPAVLRGSGAM